jgi:hypothetical protein
VTCILDHQAAFTVDYQTEDGTAKTGQDYLGNSGTLTFLAGENLKQVSVAVIGNNVLQVDRAFSLKILNPKQLQSPDIKFGTADFTQRFNVNVGIVRAADLNGDNNTDILYQLSKHQYIDLAPTYISYVEFVQFVPTVDWHV